MQVREALKHFKAARWGSPQEVQVFVDEVEQLDAAELSKFLGVLTDKREVHPDAHKFRCLALKALVLRAPTPAFFVPLVKTLAVADPFLQKTLVEVAPKVNSVDDHDALCRVVGHEHPDVRAAAGRVLEQVGGPRALEVLTAIIGKQDFHGRREAISAMVPRAKHRGLRLLEIVADAGDPRERGEAYRMAGDRATMKKSLDEARELLTQGLSDPHDRVVAEAIRGLAKVTTEDDFLEKAGRFADSGKPVTRQAFIEALREFSSQRAINLLARIRRRAPMQLRMMVVESLESIANDDVLPVLVECISDKAAPIQNRAADALVAISKDGKVELARTVTWLLRSREVQTRRLAVEIARKVGNTANLVPSLLKFLRDEDWWVRERVMDALIQLSGKRLTEHLVSYLTDESDIVRRFAVNSLRRLQDPRALGALVRIAQDDKDWWIKEDAILTIGEMGDKRAAPYIVKLFKSSVDLALPCIQALHKLQAEDGADLVAEAIRSSMKGLDTSSVRLAAIRYLAEYGEARHADALSVCDTDVDPAVRDALSTARAKWQVTKTRTATGMLLGPLDRMLVDMSEMGADDLIIASDRMPMLKHLGKLVPLTEAPLAKADVETMLRQILTKAQLDQITTLAEVDCSYEIKTHELRFRVNVFNQLTGLGAVFRIVRSSIPNMEELNLPPLVRTFGDFKNGLVMVGGPTGAGKSTTLAALIDYINRSSDRHIVSIEDPIEVVHKAKMSLINQREVGTHTADFGTALRSTVRQDPDVILVGEMRDLATISFAVMAAETGHLVFGTVHTVSADTSIDRIINSFPPGQRPQIRSMLSETLRAVLCQHLLRSKQDPSKRVLAVEILLNTPAVSSLIRKDKTFQLPAVLTTQRELGMQSMDQHLVDLVKSDQVTYEEAHMRALDKKQFEMLIHGAAPEEQERAAG